MFTAIEQSYKFMTETGCRRHNNVHGIKDRINENEKDQMGIIGCG